VDVIRVYRQSPQPAKFMFLGLGLTIFVSFGALFLLMLRKEEIHHAARIGDVERVASILDRSPHYLEETNRLGLTPLLDATWEDQAEVVDLLVRRGANLRATCSLSSEDGAWTALHIAANFGSKRSADVLIRAGADVNARTIRGDTPLDLAVEKGRAGIAELLRTNGGMSGRDMPKPVP
jgi:ankyrin repeat protein